MLILHTAFEQDLIYLWGECSFENRRLRSREKEGRCFLPWGAKPPQLRAALRAFGLRGGRKAPAEEAPTVSLLLPARGRFPLPSSPILGEIHDSGEPPALAPYYVEALVLSFTEFTQLLRIIRESGERLSFPGLLFADDLKFMCRALEYAAVLVQRGTYIPDMEPRGDSFVSQWRPIILAKYQDEFSSFASAMPPVLCGFSTDAPLEAPRSKRAGATLLLESMTDMLIRSSQQGAADRGRRVNAGNPHEIWLRSLIWQKAPLIKWNEEMASLYPQIRAWADSLKAVTAQPWRLFMRLEEPIGEGERSWTLSWHLQSTQDPSLVIPAERVWSPTEAERGWFEHTQTNPRRYMLQILGHLATRVPYIAESLEVPYPCECSLSLDNLFDFLQNHLPSIMDQGIQVQFPSTWGQISDRPRLSVRANLHDENAFAPGGRMQLSDMLDVDWSVALGDDILTEEELAMLTELKTPLTSIRGRWVILYRDEVEKITAALKKLPDKIERKEALLSSLRQEHMDAPLSEVTGSPWLANVRSLLLGTEPLEEMEAPEGFAGGG